jgi:hypothetical protein
MIPRQKWCFAVSYCGRNEAQSMLSSTTISNGFKVVHNLGLSDVLGH